jgi:hypothetical protein
VLGIGSNKGYTLDPSERLLFVFVYRDGIYSILCINLDQSFAIKEIFTNALDADSSEYYSLSANTLLIMSIHDSGVMNAYTLYDIATNTSTLHYQTLSTDQDSMIGASLVNPDRDDIFYTSLGNNFMFFKLSR